MVWRLTVFRLCSYCLFWRRLGRFLFPGAGVAVGGPVVVLDELSTGLPEPSRGGVAEKGPALPRTGEEYCATSPSPLPGPGVAENCRGGFWESRAEIIWGPCWAFKISSFFAV